MEYPRCDATYFPLLKNNTTVLLNLRIYFEGKKLNIENIQHKKKLKANKLYF